MIDKIFFRVSSYRLRYSESLNLVLIDMFEEKNKREEEKNILNQNLACLEITLISSATYKQRIYKIVTYQFVTIHNWEHIKRNWTKFFEILPYTREKIVHIFECISIIESPPENTILNSPASC